MKKIMFNDQYGLTQAVLEGRKTMTRRVFMAPLEELNSINRALLDEENVKANRKALIDKYAKYKVGEVLAVAQSYGDIFTEADKGDYWDDCYERFRQAQVDDKPGWSNKMFVSADLMPHQIRINDIKLELLQDISDDDCLKEGVEKWMDCYIVAGIMERGKHNVCFDTPCNAFARLIDKVSKRGTWAANPWTWAYEFELVK